MNISATNYKNVTCGHYQGPLFTIELNCNDKGLPPTLNNKEIYFLVDISGSMCQVLPIMKKTLIELKKGPCENLKITLITFNNEARMIYPDGTQSFEDCVNDLHADGNTNLSGALELAYAKRRENSARTSWIIVLTDGKPNIGFTRIEEFKSLPAPRNTRIIVLGYGTDFDREICNTIGHFVYVPSEDEIPIVTQNIIQEIIASWASDAKIIVRDEIEDVGTRYVGPLYDGKKFIYIAKGNIKILPVDYEDMNVNNCLFVYREIDTREIAPTPLEVVVSNAERVPEYVLDIFYDLLISSMLLKLSRGNSKEIIGFVRREISLWTRPEAGDRVEEVIKNIEKSRKNSRQYVHAVNSASASAAAFSSQVNYSPSIQMSRATATRSRLAFAGYGAVATGSGAAATGSGSTTTGYGAAATGSGSTTTGYGAAATGSGSTTTGYGAAATGSGSNSPCSFPGTPMNINSA